MILSRGQGSVSCRARWDVCGVANIFCFSPHIVTVVCAITVLVLCSSEPFIVPAEAQVTGPFIAAEQTNLDDLHARIAELTPDVVSGAELLSGQVRLVGCSRPKNGTADVRAASHFYVTAYFEFMPEVQAPFDRELLVSLDKIDIARIPIRVERPRPGEVVKRDLALYIPRNASSGATTLRAGFVEEGSPGESRTSMSLNMAPLISLDVGPADPVPEIEPDKKRALLTGVARRDARNLVRNGGFEMGLVNWTLSDGLLEGLGGWSRIVSIKTDRETVVEGYTSLRIDFGGAHDTDFYHITQDITVKRSAEYVISYFVKTQDLTSNEGPSIVIRDPDLAIDAFYKATPKNKRLRGTNDWTPVEFVFTTAQTTTRLRIVIRRHGSGSDSLDPERFGPVSGSVWFDSIRLIEQ